MKSIDLSNSGLSAKAVQEIAGELSLDSNREVTDWRNTESLKGNITLEEVTINGVGGEVIKVSGDDLIVGARISSEDVILEVAMMSLTKILESNRAIAKVGFLTDPLHWFIFSKCFSGESVEANLSYRGLEKVPELLLVVPTLISLDLSFNKLRTLPRAIKQLSFLENLNLSNNQLVVVRKTSTELIILNIRISFHQRLDSLDL